MEGAIAAVTGRWAQPPVRYRADRQLMSPAIEVAQTERRVA